jgi:hypothetical protein
MGFKYDNVLMEESAQILEIETFIPFVLQNQDPEAPPRLKRMGGEEALVIILFYFMFVCLFVVGCVVIV